YTSAGWRNESSQPFTVVPIGGNCTVLNLYNALIEIGTAPGVIDARGCTNGVVLTGGSDEYNGPPQSTSHNGLTFRNDLAIIADKFNLSGGARFTGAGSGSRLWLINPDTS